MSWITDYISINDFGGEYYIPVQDHAQFQSFLNSEVEKIITELLGIELYESFVSGLNTNTDYQKLRDGETYLTVDSNKVQYLGFKSFLVPFIYSELQKSNYKMSQNGMIYRNSDNSERISEFTCNVISRNNYNKAVSLYINAALYIKNNLSKFDNWVFKPKKTRTI